MEYIDLGLPSGNLWAVENEEDYYTFDEAVAKFGDNLPTKEDFEELVAHCWARFDRRRKGMEFMGDNKAKIFLSTPFNDSFFAPDRGRYWSSTNYRGHIAGIFTICPELVRTYGTEHFYKKLSICLVQRKLNFNKHKILNNIFENAKIGDKFKARNGKIFYYQGIKEGSKYVLKDKHGNLEWRFCDGMVCCIGEDKNDIVEKILNT